MSGSWNLRRSLALATVLAAVAGIAPAAAQAASPNVTYHGGPVISNVKVYVVIWGSGTYNPETTDGHVGNFVTAFTASGIFDIPLAQYSTAGVGGNQVIGHGTFGGAFTITPSASADGSTVSDSEIQTELTAQITAGHLPHPDANAVYVLFFGNGQTITHNGLASLQPGGFCSYHGWVGAGGGISSFPYIVMPDLGSATGCGNGTAFQNTTTQLSRQLANVVTDPTGQGWHDASNRDIGDICSPQSDSAFLAPYTVALFWDNSGNLCAAAPGNRFSLSLSPGNVSVAPGSSVTAGLSSATVSGVTVAISLSVSGAPSGVTTSLSPTVVTAGGSSMLTISTSSSVAPGMYTLTVTGVAAAAPGVSQSIDLALTVTAVDTTPPTITCPANITVDSGPAGTTTVTYAATASDPDDAVAGIVYSPASGSALAIGTTTVTATATDTHGNSSACSFTVTVRPTVESVCSLTIKYVQGSAKYQPLPPWLKSVIDSQAAAGACANLAALTANLTPAQKQHLVALYDNAVHVLAGQGWLTPAQAAELKTDAGLLVA